jgi:phosphate-selective porin OprO/OprP
MLLVSSVLLPGSLHAQDAAGIEARLRAVEARLGGLEQRVDHLGGLSSPVLNTPGGGTEPWVDPQSDRLEALDQKLRILERKKELEKEEADAKRKDAVTVAAGREGFALSSADKSFQLKLGATIQADSRFFRNDATDSLRETFTLGRTRPIIQGTVYKYIDFKLMPDFGGGTVTVQDAYVDLRYVPRAIFRLGKAKSPFGLERLQSDTDVWFYDRGLPTGLVPNRDEGVQLYSTLGSVLTYQAAITNGPVDGGSLDVANSNHKELVGRLFATPFQPGSLSLLKGLGFGISGSSGEQFGPLPSFRTTGQNTFFSYLATARANGNRVRYSPQIDYFYGPFGLLGEYVQSTQNITGASGSRSITNSAWQIAGTYFLTGDAATYGRVTPKRDFSLADGGRLGGLQLAGRYMVLSADPAAFAAGLVDPSKSSQKAKAWTVGFNWYFNRFVKYTFDFEHTDFTRGASAGANRPTEEAFLSKMQVAF